MTVRVVSDNAKTWIGESGDTKPETKVIGSRFLELDTGKPWIWNGSAWVADLTYNYSVAVV